MKQGILILIGTVAILAVFGVWIYLLIFGTPETAREVFTDFGLGSDSVTERMPADQLPLDITQTVDIGTSAHSQLTTRAVAGFSFIADATSTEKIRYAERGVGHVYEIDLSTNMETRVLGKTFAAITNATFNSDATAVVLIAEDGYETTAYLEEITDAATAISHAIPPDAQNVAFVGNDDLRYTRVTPDGMVGYSYDLENKQTVQLFSIPFRDASVIWKQEETLVYNNPAPYLLGALYQIQNGTLTRIGESAYGFSGLAHPYAATYVRTYVDLETNMPVSVAGDGSSEVQLPIITYPEKCAGSPIDARVLWCGAPLEDIERSHQTDWYKGLTPSNDLLWHVDTASGEAVVFADFFAESGRVVDIDRITMDQFGNYLLMRNKIDGALWLYDTTAAQ